MKIKRKYRNGWELSQYYSSLDTKKANEWLCWASSSNRYSPELRKQIYKEWSRRQ